MIKRIMIAAVLILLLVIGIVFFPKRAQETVVQEATFPIKEEFQAELAKNMRNAGIDIQIDGMSVLPLGYKTELRDNMQLMVSEEFLEDLMGCAVFQSRNKFICLERGEVKIVFQENSDYVTINGDMKKLESGPLVTDQAEIMFPLTQFAEEIDYDFQYHPSENVINFVCRNSQNPLPRRYDLRTEDRVTPIRDQGRYGTCWAFASLGALETSRMPKEYNVYSTDHMTLNNSYHLDLSQGGEHTMSIAYLAAWQGPVYEQDDPYGDGKTDENLTAVKHLEEAIVVNQRDDAVLKNAIYKYGGVETSLYLDMNYIGDNSQYFNDATNGYYYDGDKKPNHDLVVVGWDDDYPKEMFSIRPQENGAFICRNSWGTEFGENGYFYVSYEDTTICQQSIVYSRLVDADNFDRIYQSDLLGWVGQLGYGSSKAYFANVFKAGKSENLAAVSFYATGPDTTFSVYLVRDFVNEKSFSKKVLLCSGETRYAGYYTARIPKEVELRDMERFAVVVQVETPGSNRPIAIEYQADARTAGVDISDGEGYISLYGDVWHRAEESQECNVCLKAFTNRRK